MIRFRSWLKKSLGIAGAGAFTVTLMAISYWAGQGEKQIVAAAQTAVNNPLSNPNEPSTQPVKQEDGSFGEVPRVIAYVYGNVPITREEFGDYLIQRYGAERLELFVNKRILEIEAARKKITVTSTELDADIAKLLRESDISKSDFVSKILKRYGMTYEEFREDMTRMRLLGAKMCRDQIQVSEEDLRKLYENRYGRKAEIQVIIWPRTDPNYMKHAMKAYENIRKSDADFDTEAKKQADVGLASCAGKAKPLPRYNLTGSNEMEDEVFKLKKGELSRILDQPIGAVVVKCNGFIEPEKGKSFEEVRKDLEQEVIEQKLAIEIRKYFAKLRDEAKPVLVLQVTSKDPTGIQRGARKAVNELMNPINMNPVNMNPKK